MRTPLLPLFLLLLSYTVLGQHTPFEQQYVVLADGSEALLWISLDEQSELLHYKVNERDAAAVYAPEAVVSFHYGGQPYYSLPLRDGYFTFFKVYHEGSEFAVLEKAPSYKALQVITDESGGQLSLCQGSRSKAFTLCFTDTRQSTHAVMGTPVVSSVRKFVVHKLIYLAIEGQLKLFYLDSDEGFSLWNDWALLNANKRSALNTLEAGRKSTLRTLSDMIDDPQKMSVIEQKVKQDKLDVRNPQQLILALEAVYR
ncbi:hypothetical protein [Cesiribacter andamanensis]|uniref:Uncharacterized protein n=1 Tax=Cesiribacter andamanensis AMV16 TaxID=1279009 RepID=M7P2M4_9BACT|nr:hypothetical protein [Cesiribacter andamanensis]EMR04784.1 hypothetical protein ADICEAN_00055 [Cesiribacter andamanensis AMV16]